MWIQWRTYTTFDRITKRDSGLRQKHVLCVRAYWTPPPPHFLLNPTEQFLTVSWCWEGAKRKWVNWIETQGGSKCASSAKTVLRGYANILWCVHGKRCGSVIHLSEKRVVAVIFMVNVYVCVRRHCSISCSLPLSASLSEHTHTNPHL